MADAVRTETFSAPEHIRDYTDEELQSLFIRDMRSRPKVMEHSAASFARYMRALAEDELFLRIGFQSLDEYFERVLNRPRDWVDAALRLCNEAIREGRPHVRVGDIAAKVQELKEQNPEATQREIAEVVGVSVPRVNQLINSETHKHKASQRQAARQLYLPKDAGQAAAKIRAKFGAEFTQQLKEAL